MKIGIDMSIQATTDIERQKHARLVDAAQQFEATMLQELLKPMQPGQSSWGEKEKTEDTASDTIGSFGTEAIAKAISKGGGFGIAKQIVSKVAREQKINSEKKA